MNKLRKEIEEAERVLRLIKGEIEEPDASKFKTENELIREQLELMEDEPKEEKKPYRHLCHTMDSHSSGSFVYTGIGYGLKPDETTLTRFSERKKR